MLRGLLIFLRFYASRQSNLRRGIRVMKIYVCVKQIPDPNTVVSKLDPKTKRLVRSGISLVLDPGDETTISAAIKLRDKLGGSEVIAVSMGPTTAQEALRRALAMGVDR